MVGSGVCAERARALMSPALLAAMPPAAFQLPIYANFSAAAVSDPAEERELLVKQVCGRVRWRESMLAMDEAGVEQFVEIGGKVVGPMVGRTVEDVQVVSVVTMTDIEGLAATLG